MHRVAPQKRVKDELEKGSQFASERSSAEREVNVHRSNIEKFTQRLDDARQEKGQLQGRRARAEEEEKPANQRKAEAEQADAAAREAAKVAQAALAATTLALKEFEQEEAALVKAKEEQQRRGAALQQAEAALGGAMQDQVGLPTGRGSNQP